MTDTNVYPECEKLQAVLPQKIQLEEFLQFLKNKGIVFGEWHGNYMEHAHVNEEELIADFLNINLKRLEAERQSMMSKINR